MSAGLLLAPMIDKAWQLYVTLGVLVSAGANLTTYTAHSLFLPNWFCAAAGSGDQHRIFRGWRRRACAAAVVADDHCSGRLARVLFSHGADCIMRVGPLILFLRRSPESIGLLPDGATRLAETNKTSGASNVRRSGVGGGRLDTRAGDVVPGGSGGSHCHSFAPCSWYAVQVHQTRYLTEIGFTPLTAAWALGIVSVVAIPGQIGLGALSDRVGRAWLPIAAWSISGRWIAS